MDEFLKDQISDRCEVFVDEEDEGFWAVIGERIVTHSGNVTFLSAAIDSESDGVTLWITDTSIYPLLSGESDDEGLEKIAANGLVENIEKAPYQEEIAELFNMIMQKAEERR